MGAEGEGDALDGEEGIGDGSLHMRSIPILGPTCDKTRSHYAAMVACPVLAVAVVVAAAVSRRRARRLRPAAR